MATLSGQYLDLAYGDLLQVANSGTGLDSTLRYVSNGKGINSVLQISTSAVNVQGTFTINGSAIQNISVSGGFTLGFTVTANTALTLPITGTVATLAGAETFTNKTITNPIIATISNTGTLTLPTSTDTLVGRATTDTLTNKTLTSPVMTTPTLGVASASSINKVTITAPATSSTLTVADGKTLTSSNTLTLTGTDGSSVAFGTGGTVSYITAATQTDQETATSTTLAVTPGRQHFHPSSPKAWGAIVGSNGAINASYGISSVIRNSTGNYTITWTTSFSSSNYSINLCASQSGTVVIPLVVANPTAGLATVQVYTAGGTSVDPVVLYVQAWGDL